MPEPRRRDARDLSDETIVQILEDTVRFGEMSELRVLAEAVRRLYHPHDRAVRAMGDAMDDVIDLIERGAR